MRSYETSTDYNLLWDLIQQGHRIVGQLDDLGPVTVNIKIGNSGFLIATNGYGYEGFENTKEAFLRICNKFNLQFIEPTKIYMNNTGDCKLIPGDECIVVSDKTCGAFKIGQNVVTYVSSAKELDENGFILSDAIRVFQKDVKSVIHRSDLELHARYGRKILKP